jgi:hypothetical protein
VTSDYGLSDLKEAMKDLYRKAGVRPAEPLVFMLADGQVHSPLDKIVHRLISCSRVVLWLACAPTPCDAESSGVA